jgi:hypothetical protein
MGYITHMVKIKNSCKIFIGKYEGKIHVGNLGADVRITLKWIPEK